MSDSSQLASAANVAPEQRRPSNALTELVRGWFAPRLEDRADSSQSRWSLALDSRRSRVACGSAAALTFGTFLGYFGLLCFRHDWGGDIQLYCAAVSRLYENPLHPSHEAVTAPGTQSFAFSPYLVAVGMLGNFFGVSPYRSLQLAGMTNLLLFAAGAAYFFSRHSIHRRWELAAACFLLVTLFVRWRHFGWSSETSVITMQYLQAYPSTIAWALAFFAFGSFRGVVAEGDRSQLLVMGVIVAVLMLTHALTASWTVGIFGLYSLVTAVHRRQWRPLARALAALGIGLSLALLWPYSPLLGQSSLVTAREGSPFGESPFLDMVNLYCLALPCAAYSLLRLRKHGFWLLGFAATLTALTLWRALDFNYGNRYAFFMAFFAQFIVAEVAALGLLALFRPLAELAPTRRWPKLDRPFAILVLLSALVAWLPSPMWEKHHALLRSPATLLEIPSPHDAYYAKLPELRPYLSAEDVLLMPVSHFVFDIASITGARFISAPYTVRVPDQHARFRDVQTFFDPATQAADRVAIAHDRGATRVLLLNWQFNLVGELTRLFGTPLFQDENYAVFDTTVRGS